MDSMLLTKEIVKAARQLVVWTSNQLSEHSGVGHDTIRSFESGRTKSLSAENQDKVQKAFEAAGVQFLKEGDTANGSGVALSNQT